MLEAKQASFSFEDFTVVKFSYDKKNDNGNPMKVGFTPSGIFELSNGIFKLRLDFTAFSPEQEDKPIFSVSCLAIFEFPDKPSYDEIPKYFYANAIAIVFPYLRAFVSTLTLQANTKVLRLGLFNLSELEKPLRESTKVI
ncbi:hypothetical protein RT717_12010 [Imperialibacter roseus]|uniref:Preprotein translocase subunit SecB n=1 Tax=Imperialibacter roseus TaxID=1324217 RepID=A0ABZ0IWK2_9BACT|nr:hypothetical protein [Imperialibacter roseus]WOK09364.1 hypothetical protein RT717_12010 [Imperialibacter roseus]